MLLLWGELVKKSCHYCGHIHDKGFICPRKPIMKKKYNDVNKFRNTGAWRRTRTAVKLRDNNLCQACLHRLQGTLTHYTTQDLEVHHIVPLHEDYELRQDHDNLITLCEAHHEMADHSTISREVLRQIAYKNNIH